MYSSAMIICLPVINYIIRYSLASIVDTCGALPAVLDATLVAEVGVLSPIVFIPKWTYLGTSPFTLNERGSNKSSP
jgi:hypothetical protein